MSTSYVTLLSLRLAHDYFPEGSRPAVAIVPTQQTALIMQQLGVKMVDRDFGVELFYAEPSMGAAPLLNNTEMIRLAFLLRPTEQLFYNYTDLPTSIGTSAISYLTNLTPAAGGTFEVGKGQALPPAPALVKIEEVGEEQGLSLQDELGNELAALSPDSAPETTGELMTRTGTAVEVDLSANSPGLYTLEGADKAPQTILRYPSNHQAGDLGLLAIFLGKGGASGQAILQDGKVTPTTFTLLFTARKTVWRYLLIDSSNNGFGQFELIDKSTQLPLAPVADPPITKDLPNGQTATVLSSPTAIPLRQRPGPRFELRMKSSTPGPNASVTLPLPSANAQAIAREEAAPESTENFILYSDMYVYL